MFTPLSEVFHMLAFIYLFNIGGIRWFPTLEFELTTQRKLVVQFHKR
jgi:hypothetical protein